MSQQFLRFLLVGGVATIIHYAVLYFFYRIVGLNGVVSTSVGFVISALFNFIASYHYTFRSRSNLVRAAFRYAIVAILGLSLNAVIFWVLAIYFLVYYVVAQVVATGVVVAWSFLAGRFFAFAGEGEV